MMGAHSIGSEEGAVLLAQQRPIDLVGANLRQQVERHVLEIVLTGTPHPHDATLAFNVRIFESLLPCVHCIPSASALISLYRTSRF